jgi:hypothetical protein
MEGHVLASGGDVEFVGIGGCVQGVQLRAGVLDHAQDVVVVGVGVGPLLHDCGDGVPVGAVGVDLVAHAQ